MGYQKFSDSLIEFATDINNFIKDSADKFKQYCG